jgi:hypothetical protein
MDELGKMLTDREKELRRVIECARKCIESGPEGSLRVCRNKNTAQYYVRDVSSGNRWEYVSKNKWEKVQKLAQKEYAEQVLKKAQHSLKIIEKLIKSYQPDELTDVYNKLVPGRQQLVKPYIYTDEMYEEEWEKSYTPDPDQKLNYVGTDIYTENNEMVRSKTEKILADKFKLLGIPYIYEKPLFLKGMGTVHPDFTLFNRHAHKEIYWEHLGMMDDVEYSSKAIKKIEAYENNGIFTGDRLILTYETHDHTFSTRNAELLIHKYFD